MENDRKLKMISKLDNLIRLKRDINVTFINNDNSRINQQLNSNFISDRIGRTRTSNAILNDLYAIKHDKNAKTFFI